MRTRSKQLLALGLAVAFLAAACGGGGDVRPDECDGAEEGLPDLECRTVTVAVENAYIPYNFIEEGETLGTGWDYDAWEAICDALNCKAEFVEAGWPQVIDETGAGQYDTAADGISITEERKAVVAYSQPYMVVNQKFIVRTDETRFDSADAFIAGDYILGTQVGTTNYELGVELLGGEDRINAFDQFGLAVEALIAGDVDAVIIDDTAGQGYVGVNAPLVRTLPQELQSDPLGFIYPHGSDLIGPVDQALDYLEANGTLEQLAVKWFIEFSQ